MLKKIVIGLLLFPCVVLGSDNSILESKGNDGHNLLIDGNYECFYNNFEKANQGDNKLSGAELYIEKMENDTVLFIASLPGDISFNPPIAERNKQKKDSISYYTEDDNGNGFVIGYIEDIGLVSAINIDSGSVKANILIYDCKIIRNLDNPVSAK